TGGVPATAASTASVHSDSTSVIPITMCSERTWVAVPVHSSTPRTIWVSPVTRTSIWAAGVAVLIGSPVPPVGGGPAAVAHDGRGARYPPAAIFAPAGARV